MESGAYSPASTASAATRSRRRRKRAPPGGSSRNFIARSAISTTASATAGSASTTRRAICARLRELLVEQRGHRHFDVIEPLAERVLEAAAALPPLPASPDRIVHGDPKISNLVFAHDADRALCLIDLDTLAHMPVALELGDALRSWCNPATEDAASARFVRPFFDAAIGGYAEAAQGFLTPAEWSAIPRGALTITVELAARFCADALRESYFGWNRARYESSSAHNQARDARPAAAGGRHPRRACRPRGHDRQGFRRLKRNVVRRFAARNVHEARP